MNRQELIRVVQASFLNHMNCMCCHSDEQMFATIADEIGTASVILESSELQTLQVKKLHPEAVLPTRAHAEDAGLDLFALEDKFIPIGTTVKIHTGIAIDVPIGYYAQIKDRSSMAKRGLITGAGVIDAGYTGECSVMLHNFSAINSGSNGYYVHQGDKIAQVILQKIELPRVVEVDDFSGSHRGDNGWGSSGK